MGDAGVTQIPKANQPHLTTVTIKNDPTIQPAGPVVVLNVNYISSWHGLLKGLQLLFAIICMACASPATHPGTSWFLCVVVITFIFTLLWLSFHFLSMETLLVAPNVNWLRVEFYYVLFATLFYITGMITQLVVWSKADAQKYFASSNLAAGSFGFFNTLAYGAETLLIFLEL